ncbi:hypothetical protein AADQ46_000170 [Enterobacter soli]
MMNFLSVEQGSRPSRPVVIRPAGDGLAAPLAGATQWSAWKPKEFVPRGMRVAQGKLFSLEGCGHEAQGAAVPPTGFTTRQGRLGPNHSERRWGRLGIPARMLPRCAY